MKRPARLLALVLTVMLVAAACGSDDEADTGVDTDPVTADDGSEADTDSTDDTTDDDTMEDDTMEDDTMEDDTMEDDTMEDDTMEDDTMEDDTMEDEGAVADTVLGLAITSINFETEEVVIANGSNGEIDLDGFFLCSFPSYAKIEDVGTVAPGESVTVISPVALSASAGELGLYTTDSYSSPDAIQAYVEWGTPDHERAPVAIEAGIYDGTPLIVEGNTLIVG